jgi:co-chaperonin GroES (HSP10)
MKCKIQVLNHRVLLEEQPFKDRSEGGILFPPDKMDHYQNQQTEGLIIDMGPECFDFIAEERRPKIGDILFYQRYDGIGRKYGNKYYRILNDEMAFAKSDRFIEQKEELYGDR